MDMKLNGTESLAAVSAEAHEITLREHLTRARKFAKPENMARDPRKMKKAALKRWEGKRKKDLFNKARHVEQNK